MTILSLHEAQVPNGQFWSNVRIENHHSERDNHEMIFLALFLRAFGIHVLLFLDRVDRYDLPLLRKGARNAFVRYPTEKARKL